MSGQHPDQGFTLVEVLLVILVLGLMTTVVVSAAGGFTAEAEESSCATERHELGLAVERYFAEQTTSTIAPVDASADGFEKTLVDAGVLKSVSLSYDLDADGDFVVPAGSPCQPVA